MPGFDRSGPMGAGPMTGGGRGFCGRNAGTGQDQASGSGRGFGRGFRGRFGRRSGFGHDAAAPAGQSVGPATDTDEIRYLQASVEELRTALGRIEQRLSEQSASSNE